MKLNVVAAKPLAEQPRPTDRLHAFLDVLLCGAMLVVETDDPIGVHRQAGYDKADTWKQLARMPFDFANNPAGPVPWSRLILEVIIDPQHMVWQTTNQAFEQMGNLALQNTDGFQTDGVEVIPMANGFDSYLFDIGRFGSSFTVGDSRSVLFLFPSVWTDQTGGANDCSDCPHGYECGNASQGSFSPF